MTATISYGISFLSGADAQTRISRQRQSTAAQILLEVLKADAAANVSSKTHSRTVVAAAVGDSGITALGIDVEFMEPERPFAALAGFLTGTASMPIGAEAFYRCWTFAEAYFKAFQQVPPEWTIREISALSQSDERYRLADDTHILQRRIAQQFQLCLVWRSTQLACELRYLQQ